MPATPERIVLTGGPGAGKTVITRALLDRFPDRFVLVAEAATAVYSVLGTRWDRLDLAKRRDVQRQIYAHQIVQEHRVAGAHPNKTLLLDRGTIDGAAYWPDGIDAYWIDRNTSLDQELARYSMVIWLETAAALGIYDGSTSNAIRFEDASAAIASGQQLRELWRGHPNLHHVGAFVSLEDKIEAVIEILTKP